MNTKRFLLAMLALALAFLFAGCLIQTGSQTGFSVIDTTNGVDSIPGEFTVSRGSTFAFTLESNPTTGYTWQVDIEDEDVLELESSEFDADDPEADGSGGITTLTFKAKEAGSTLLTLTYAQDWEGGDTDKTKTLTIIVE